ncbi:MAG: penicillin-binding protein activator, partial [Salinisphaera sp.]|nr:penicillin-binding protein activator [Salinisphaera sp.]
MWKLRAELLFASGRPIQGVHALVQRGVWLLDPAAMRANQDLIWTRLRKVSEPGKRLTSVKEVGRVTRGWVQLATIADHSWTDRKALEDRLALWARRYPDHPASQHLLAQQFDYQPPASTGNYLANTGVIGLALPLSGRYRHAAAAIRDGFVAGYYALGSQQVSLRVYDASRFNSNAALLTQARKDGVGLLVGPLDKQRVAALTRAPAPQMAVLALNYSDTSQRFPGFFQFGLAPEDEARAVARRAIAQGWHRALALVPEGDWGGRVLQAFRDTLAAAGGRLVDYATYDPSLPDHAKPIQRLLQHYQPRSQTPDGKTVAFHTGVDFFFLAAEPGQARLIRSQLRFYRAGHLPLLATSDVYTGEPQPTKDDDLNGLVFADMPWLLGSNPDVRAMRKQLATVWGNDEQGFPRLFAMGLDAWRLAKHMRAGQLAPGRLFHGATGTLYLQPDGQIRRRLDFARFVQGAPKPLPEVETPMTP